MFSDSFKFCWFCSAIALIAETSPGFVRLALVCRRDATLFHEVTTGSYSAGKRRMISMNKMGGLACADWCDAGDLVDQEQQNRESCHYSAMAFTLRYGK
jgi:hypothetical protein